MPFIPRDRFDWRLCTRTLALGERTLIMGILNVTPDSFSDGGLFYTPGDTVERAVAHALEMLDEGADIIDVGGESTRPGATPLDPEEEQRRVLPVIEAILRLRPDAVLSIDTFHAATAERAVAAGAEIVNDVSGHTWDAAMSAACAGLGCGAVLMYTRGNPQQWRTQTTLASGEVIPLVLDGLAASVATAIAAGVARESIVIDPGFGFGKRLDENYPLLAGLDRLRQLGLPMLVGLSRKSFLGQGTSFTAQTASDALLHATTAANTAAVLAGAHILRVHDVRAGVQAAAIADRILTASRG